jgi:hypothetical protein
MKIYHGSDVAVPKPIILPANRFLDFGEGFYTTSSLVQARRWAHHVCERNKKQSNSQTNNQIVSIYEFDISRAKNELKIKHFASPTSKWLNFVTACRTGKGEKHGFDIVMGPVANDNVYATIQLYETGLLSEAETIIRLKVEKIFDQILFHTEKSLQYCSYISHENAGGN